MIRVTFNDGTTADLPEDTHVLRSHSLEYGDHGDRLADCRRFTVVVQRDGAWEWATVETWEQEALRLRAALADETTRANLAEEVARRLQTIDARSPTTDTDNVSPAHLEALTIVAYSDGCDGQIWAARHLIAMGPEAVAEAVSRSYEDGRRAGQNDHRRDSRSLGDLINTRARAGAEVVDAREALSRIPKKGVPLVRQMAEDRLSRAERTYRQAQAAEGSSPFSMKVAGFPTELAMLDEQERTMWRALVNAQDALLRATEELTAHDRACEDCFAARQALGDLLDGN